MAAFLFQKEVCYNYEQSKEHTLYSCHCILFRDDGSRAETGRQFFFCPADDLSAIPDRRLVSDAFGTQGSEKEKSAAGQE